MSLQDSIASCFNEFTGLKSLIDSKICSLNQDIVFWRDALAELNVESDAYYRVLNHSIQPREGYRSLLQDCLDNIQTLGQLEQIVTGSSNDDNQVQGVSIYRTMQQLLFSGQRLQRLTVESNQVPYYIGQFIGALNQIQRQYKQSVIYTDHSCRSLSDIRTLLETSQPTILQYINHHMNQEDIRHDALINRAQEELTQGVQTVRNTASTDSAISQLKLYQETIQSFPEFNQLNKKTKHMISHVFQRHFRELNVAQKQGASLSVLNQSSNGSQCMPMKQSNQSKLDMNNQGALQPLTESIVYTFQQLVQQIQSLVNHSLHFGTQPAEVIQQLIHTFSVDAMKQIVGQGNQVSNTACMQARIQKKIDDYSELIVKYIFYKGSFFSIKNMTVNLLPCVQAYAESIIPSNGSVDVNTFDWFNSLNTHLKNERKYQRRVNQYKRHLLQWKRQYCAYNGKKKTIFKQQLLNKIKHSQQLFLTVNVNRLTKCREILAKNGNGLLLNAFGETIATLNEKQETMTIYLRSIVSHR